MGDIFSNSDEKYDYWRPLFESIVDKNAPMKKKRVAEWKQAIRNKRNRAALFAKNRTVKNLELKKKYWNIATQERRKAIKAYWHKKSEELKSTPNEFFKALRPFIGTETKDSDSISLQWEGGILEKEQTVVAERLRLVTSLILLQELEGNMLVD